MSKRIPFEPDWEVIVARHARKLAKAIVHGLVYDMGRVHLIKLCTKHMKHLVNEITEHWY